jgi:hypothetical protein
MFKKKILKRMSSAANAVQHALSVQKAQFHHEMNRIEGEVNKQGGGQASISSGIFVARFSSEIQRELNERAERAKCALSEALKLQERYISKSFAEEIKGHIRPVWNREICDLHDWYRLRVEGANTELEKQRPFEPASEQALAAVFVDIENRALAPGFWVRNKGLLATIVIAIIGWIVALSRCGKTH